ncbi:hypothetical protein [Caballeronia sp. DA-9]|uniref:hypothetical protein n=1 Tax=Caballeronia sp. DA-9 TaxID=3436237 RepID=UPI003F663296
MALAALRSAQGNADLVGELLKTTYWTFYLSDEGTLMKHKENFVAAERSLKASIARAVDTRRGMLAMPTQFTLQRCSNFMMNN